MTFHLGKKIVNTAKNQHAGASENGCSEGSLSHSASCNIKCLDGYNLIEQYLKKNAVSYALLSFGASVVLEEICDSNVEMYLPV